MSDYISREEAIMAVTRAKLPDTTPEGVPIANGKRSVTDCVRRIKDIPAADVRPVVRGKWEWDVLDGTPGYRPVVLCCSNCHRVSFSGWDYCPNCGAKMDGGDAQ